MSRPGRRLKTLSRIQGYTLNHTLKTLNISRYRYLVMGRILYISTRGIAVFRGGIRR